MGQEAKVSMEISFTTRTIFEQLRDRDDKFEDDVQLNLVVRLVTFNGIEGLAFYFQRTDKDKTGRHEEEEQQSSSDDE